MTIRNLMTIRNFLLHLIFLSPFFFVGSVSFAEVAFENSQENLLSDSESDSEAGELFFSVPQEEKKIGKRAARKKAEEEARLEEERKREATKYIYHYPSSKEGEYQVYDSFVNIDRITGRSVKKYSRFGDLEKTREQEIGPREFFNRYKEAAINPVYDYSINYLQAYHSRGASQGDCLVNNLRDEGFNLLSCLSMNSETSDRYYKIDINIYFKEPNWIQGGRSDVLDYFIVKIYYQRGESYKKEAYSMAFEVVESKRTGEMKLREKRIFSSDFNIKGKEGGSDEWLIQLKKAYFKSESICGLRECIEGEVGDLKKGEKEKSYWKHEFVDEEI